MLLVPIVYRNIYNQGFAIGWNRALGQILAFRAAKGDTQAQQEMQDWFRREAADEQAGHPFNEPAPSQPIPPPLWQEPELPAWIFGLAAAICAVGGDAFATLMFLAG